MSKDTPKPNTTNSELIEELRQGSEARHMANRVTPDGKELVEMIPLDWAVEVIEALIASKVNEAERNIELYYLEKLCKVYDDINTGVAKKPSNSTYYINKAIHTEEEIKSIKTLQSREQDKV